MFLFVVLFEILIKVSKTNHVVALNTEKTQIFNFILHLLDD